MRPVLPEKKINYKLLIIYISIFIICIIGIGMSMYMQYFRDDHIGVIFGVTNSEEEDKYNDLKNNFYNIFTNDIDIMQEDVDIKKIQEEYDIVATRKNIKEQKDEYTLDVSIPIINIENETIDQYNNNLSEKYEQKVNEIMADTGYIYTVKYKAYIQNNILSLVIYSELKEKTSNQKIMLETYNYNLLENKEVTLEELLTLKNIDTNVANNKIKNEIKQISEQNNSLTELGYNLYQRDLSSDIYEVKNVKQYFYGEDGNIYVVFAYGNDNETSEMDIVIFMDEN